MNRYSLFFALLIASTFAVQAPPSGETRQTSSPANPKAKNAAKALADTEERTALVDAPASFIQKYVDKSEVSAERPLNLDVVFFTVPHPLETHLAEAFDHNVDALESGLQDVGYEFDSAWIPWREHPQRDSFDDDVKEQEKRNAEDQQPGVLLFRKSVLSDKKIVPREKKAEQMDNAYRPGVLVFLITEKPTEGISLIQVRTAIAVLRKEGVGLKDPIRILGPTFSGSLSSLTPVLNALHQERKGANFLVRSGGLTGGYAAATRIGNLSEGLASVRVDFGSAQYDYGEWTRIAESTLNRMGIETSRVAVLSEEETGFGAFAGEYVNGTNTAQANDDKKPKHEEWNLRFPRDISSLRASYENQGIFDASAKTQPWNRFLSLKSNEQGDGDSIRSFGGGNTTESQEAILFGISEFLKQHSVRAVIISATNEEDRVFLTQFLHAHDAGVRVVLIGGTRLMMRGAMAQFRGDLVVDNYPMLPMLHDWTSPTDDAIPLSGNRNPHVFEDDVAEGTYFGAVDLMGIGSKCRLEEVRKGSRIETVFRSTESNTDSQTMCNVVNAHDEYTEPNWNQDAPDVRMPAIYVVAMGGSSTWPLAENLPRQPFDRVSETNTGASSPKWAVAMPFDLFLGTTAPVQAKSALSPKLSVSRGWKTLFLIVLAATIFYCAGFWMAVPLERSAFASMRPTVLGSFWVFKVIIPASVAALGFGLLAWAVESPYRASPSAFVWWCISGGVQVLAPAAIAYSAVKCAQKRSGVGWSMWTRAAFLPAAVSALGAVVVAVLGFRQLEKWDSGLILNAYREMRWESGLSLVPTGLLFLLALFVWCSEAGNGAAMLEARMPLPTFDDEGADNKRPSVQCHEQMCPDKKECHENRVLTKERISERRAERIVDSGMPLGFCRNAKILWTIWAIAATAIVVTNLAYEPLRQVTTLESSATTAIVLAFSGSLVFLTLADTMQFLYLWSQLRGLLRSLERQEFKRSFVPIDDFKWKYLWSFTGISLEDRRSINAAIGRCIEELYKLHGIAQFKCCTCLYANLMNRYGALHQQLTPGQVAKDRENFREMIKKAGNVAAKLIEQEDATGTNLKGNAEHAEHGLKADKKKGTQGSRYTNERAEVDGLDAKTQALERLLCLIYIGFVQTVIARLHNLFFSIAMVFSLLVLGFAIYPFVPFMPLLLCGVGLLAFVGWAFFKVFSEMDTDPILSRIVNGDEGTLQGNFYMKFAEALALPLLALASSLLPGGAGRIIELTQVVLSHTQ